MHSWLEDIIEQFRLETVKATNNLSVLGFTIFNVGSNRSIAMYNTYPLLQDEFTVTSVNLTKYVTRYSKSDYDLITTPTIDSSGYRIRPPINGPEMTRDPDSQWTNLYFYGYAGFDYDSRTAYVSDGAGIDSGIYAAYHLLKEACYKPANCCIVTPALADPSWFHALASP